MAKKLFLFPIHTQRNKPNTRTTIDDKIRQDTTFRPILLTELELRFILLLSAQQKVE